MQLKSYATKLKEIQERARDLSSHIPAHIEELGIVDKAIGIVQSGNTDELYELMEGIFKDFHESLKDEYVEAGTLSEEFANSIG